MHGFERRVLPGIGVYLSIVTSQACHGTACMRWMARTHAGPCWFGVFRVLMRHRLAACARGVGAPLDPSQQPVMRGASARAAGAGAASVRRATSTRT